MNGQKRRLKTYKIHLYAITNCIQYFYAMTQCYQQQFSNEQFPVLLPIFIIKYYLRLISSEFYRYIIKTTMQVDVFHHLSYLFLSCKISLNCSNAPMHLPNPTKRLYFALASSQLVFKIYRVKLHLIDVMSCEF